MSALNTLTLLVNSLTLVMALAFLTIILWHDPRKEQNQFFALFLFAVTVWSTGSLMAMAVSILGDDIPLDDLSQVIMQIGFSTASIMIYALTAVLVSVRPPRFRLIVVLSVLFLLSFQLLLSQDQDAFTSNVSPAYQLHAILYVVFSGTALYLLWRYRARVPTLTLRFGIAAFVIGQGFGLMNTQLETLSLSVMTSSSAVLLLGLAILRREIIQPLRERTSQVEAMHNMSLAISSQLALQTIMEQIAQQAGKWLHADGVGIFLREGELARLMAVYGLPQQYIGLSLPQSAGVANEVIRTRRSVHLENYGREWNKEPDLPLALETFGAVICVPLVSGEHTIGALMVIAGRHNRAFRPDDRHLLEMIGAQAAVAITHGQLFGEQKRLTLEIEEARNQLSTVLTSTENPVIAVNRQLEIIFANDAAKRLFPKLRYMAQPITEVLPADVLPRDFRTVYRDIRRHRAHTYEIVHQDRIYFSHLATLGDDEQIEGWVAVLNDVTQLKELDRLKSEMIRMTSHDLKNPLQAAMANIDLLLDVLRDHPDDDVQYSVGSIDKQLNRMYRIISGVLDMERIRTGTKTLQTCRPAAVLRGAVDDLKSLADDRNIDLTVSADDDIPAFQGDPGQLERALCNLIENAIKFTPSGGEVAASARAEAGEVVFAIRDTGIGIPEEDQARVFDSFFRANQKGAEHITGTGLGLHLVKTVAENHQGRVWLESEPGSGTTFFISIPVATDDMMTQRVS